MSPWRSCKRYLNTACEAQSSPTWPLPRAIEQVLMRLPKLAICMASCNAIKALPDNLGDFTTLQVRAAGSAWLGGHAVVCLGSHAPGAFCWQAIAARGVWLASQRPGEWHEGTASGA